jgi:hypothetical protein
LVPKPWISEFDREIYSTDFITGNHKDGTIFVRMQLSHLTVLSICILLDVCRCGRRGESSSDAGNGGLGNFCKFLGLIGCVHSVFFLIASMTVLTGHQRELAES